MVCDRDYECNHLIYNGIFCECAYGSDCDFCSNDRTINCNLYFVTVAANVSLKLKRYLSFREMQMVSKRMHCVSNVYVTYKSAQYFKKQKKVLKAKT